MRDTVWIAWNGHELHGVYATLNDAEEQAEKFGSRVTSHQIKGVAKECSCNCGHDHDGGLQAHYDSQVKRGNRLKAERDLAVAKYEETQHAHEQLKTAYQDLKMERDELQIKLLSGQKNYDNIKKACEVSDARVMQLHQELDERTEQLQQVEGAFEEKDKECDEWSDFVAQIAQRLGCEREWSSSHDHRICVVDSIECLQQPRGDDADMEGKFVAKRDECERLRAELAEHAAIGESNFNRFQKEENKAKTRLAELQVAKQELALAKKKNEDWEVWRELLKRELEYACADAGPGQVQDRLGNLLTDEFREEQVAILRQRVEEAESSSAHFKYHLDKLRSDVDVERTLHGGALRALKDRTEKAEAALKKISEVERVYVTQSGGGVGIHSHPKGDHVRYVNIKKIIEEYENAGEEETE